MGRIHGALGLWSLAMTGVVAKADMCSEDPVSLPIKTVRVLEDHPDSLMRGIPASLGTPAQDIVMLPWPELNNTWIYDSQGFCDKTVIPSDLACDVRRGHLFREGSSKSYDKGMDLASVGGAPVETAYDGAETGISDLVSSSLGVTDTLTLDGSKELEEYPFGIPRMRWDHGYTYLHALGLGSNSSYLHVMREAGRIASRSWSMYWGQEYTDDNIDGSIVVGGFDSEKVMGEPHTFPLDYDDYESPTGCWTGIKVNISEVVLNTRDGEDHTIWDKEMSVCIVPQRQTLLEATDEFLNAFQQATVSESIDTAEGLSWGGQVYSTDEAFDGDMTIRFTSGLEVRVANTQYMVPDETIGRDGARKTNNDRRVLLVGRAAQAPPTLGRAFLTAAYLNVNHDNNSFSLWQANPTTSSKLVSIMSDEAKKECSEHSDGHGDGKGSGPSSTAGSSSDSGGVDAAVIGGAVAGTVVGLSAIGLAVFFYLRWRKTRGMLELASNPVMLEDTSRRPPTTYQEMPAPHHPPPREMEGDMPVCYELDASEVVTKELGSAVSAESPRTPTT